MSVNRVPDGIAFMATLTIIIGIAMVMLGVFAGNFGSLIRTLAGIFWSFPTVATYIVLVIIAFGVLTIIAGIGLYSGMKWAWYLTFVGSSIFIPVTLFTTNWIGLAIDIAILAYMLKLTTQLYYSIEFIVWW